jgi:UDP-N-acetylmuramate--alanine ligase
MFSTVKKIHFVGIGGIGMSGIAEILMNQGFKVSGSDLVASENTEALIKKGAVVMIGHKAENIEGAEVVVYSSAVHPKDNVETKAAMEAGIPIIRRAEMLAEATKFNYCLAVSGTHGKTTTTSIVGLVLIKAGIDPTVIVGGRLRDFGGSNARLGNGKWTVVEADEYDRSFLQLSPTISIVGNIEPDHLDIYKDMDDLRETFTDFANKVPFYGCVALGLDNDGCKDILKNINKKVVTYGLSRYCDYRADSISYNQGSSTCKVYEKDDLLGEITINMPGRHNLLNAMAAVAVSRKIGIEFETIKEAISEFHGVYRRFDVRGEFKNVLVVDDYAHHPTEVQAALEAARNGYDKRIVAVFQPHTFTRTQSLYEDFAKSFDNADEVIIAGIYPAREEPIEGVTGKLISDSGAGFGHRNITYIEKLSDIEQYLRENLKDGDMLITLGAGNVCDIAENLVTK